jgi:hypothetical protein
MNMKLGQGSHEQIEEGAGRLSPELQRAGKKREEILEKLPEDTKELLINKLITVKLLSTSRSGMKEYEITLWKNVIQNEGDEEKEMIVKLPIGVFTVWVDEDFVMGSKYMDMEFANENEPDGIGIFGDVPEDMSEVLHLVIQASEVRPDESRAKIESIVERTQKGIDNARSLLGLRR